MTDRKKWVGIAPISHHLIHLRCLDLWIYLKLIPTAHLLRHPLALMMLHICIRYTKSDYLSLDPLSSTHPTYVMAGPFPSQNYPPPLLITLCFAKKSIRGVSFGKLALMMNCLLEDDLHYSSCFCVDECIHNHCIWRKEQFQFNFLHLKHNSHWNTWRYFNWKKSKCSKTNQFYL